MNAVRVLIVDDEPQARRLLRTALIGHGFEVTDVASGEQAIENLREALPDVILLAAWSGQTRIFPSLLSLLRRHHGAKLKL